MTRKDVEGLGSRWWRCTGRGDCPELAPVDVLASTAEQAATHYAVVVGEDGLCDSGARVAVQVGDEEFVFVVEQCWRARRLLSALGAAGRDGEGR
jgi:hypothetical protein